jgi:hypothetical protein
MSDDMVTCQYCKCPVSSRKIQAHTSKRCPSPKSPAGISKLKEATPVKQGKKTILVRSRLERLHRDLSQGSAQPDDDGLAKEFEAFYSMFVWQGRKNVLAPRKARIDENGDISESIHTVSGGLPSLGKRAK